MTRLLGIDLGTRRTGLAFADTTVGLLCALDTISHNTTEDLEMQLAEIVRMKRIDEFVIGIPRLPGGEEGEQARTTRAMSAMIGDAFGLPVTLVDERFSSYGACGVDADAKAACALLDVEVTRRQRT